MKGRNTLFWLVVAVVLFGVIQVQRRLAPKPHPTLARVLPQLRAAQVDQVEIFRNGNTIEAKRAKDAWRLTEPLGYPAQPYAIEHLLAVLQRLTPAAYISSPDIRGRTNADTEFGFKPPRASIVLRQPNYEARLLVGGLTGPGDQVFLQVVGVDGIDVVNASLLKWIPQTANDWRDKALFDLKNLALDKLDTISVTNGGKVLQLQRDASAGLWRIVTPPIQARADNARLDDLVGRLRLARVTSFITDDPNADLDSLGLQTPGFQLGLGQGTNTLVLLNFGNSPPSHPNQIYLQRGGQPTVVTVSKDLFTPWQASVSDFRDPHLVDAVDSVGGVGVRGEDTFSLVRQGTNSWRVLPLNVPADPALVKNFLATLGSMRIVDYTKDAVTPPDLPPYGLANPSRIYFLTNSSALTTNGVVTELDFGANRDNKVYVRRPDESSIYAVGADDYVRLPVAGYQFRDRRLWEAPISSVANVTITQGGKTRQLIRNGPYQWSLAPGSQGVVNDAAIEESVQYFCKLSARVWLAHGKKSLPEYGFRKEGLAITVELKKGRKLALEFGGPTPSGSAYAAVELNGEPWIFEYPPADYRFVGTYLTLPGGR
jgi:Domain of unknown function (DUF4340)